MNSDWIVGNAVHERMTRGEVHQLDTVTGFALNLLISTGLCEG